MDSKTLESLIETIEHGAGAEAEAAEEQIKLQASDQNVSRLEALLLNPIDNLVQEAVAVPYARLRGARGLETLLRAYQVYLSSYNDSDDIRDLLVGIANSEPVESRQILRQLSQAPELELRENARWLLEQSQAEGVETPLAGAPHDGRIIDVAMDTLKLVLHAPPGKTWQLQYSGVQAFRYVHGNSFRPLTNDKSWIVKMADSQWSRGLINEAHMHPHPHPGHFAHYQLWLGICTLDVLSSRSPEFRELGVPENEQSP